MGVVVGYDGSGFALRAVDWAADEAGLRRRPLTVCHAWQRPAQGSSRGSARGPAAGAADDDALREQAERIAAEGVARARAHFARPVVRADLYEGPAAERLLELSGAAELVVVGAHGRRSEARPVACGRAAAASGLVAARPEPAAGPVASAGGAVTLDEAPPFVAGRVVPSVGRLVAARARCPVVIVHGAAQEHRTGPVAVGVNGRADIDLVLDFACREAVLRRVPLLAVHAWYRHDEFAGASPESEPEAVRAAAEARIARVLAPWRSRYPEMSVRVSAAEGTERQELLEAALDAALLVVGAPYARCGSMTAFLLHHSPCPVAIVRTQEVGL
jgi:nucleotide-binding universal stress UspA family protein